MALCSADFDYLCKLIRDRSAIVLEPGKEYLVEARLGPLAQRTGLGTIAALVSTLRNQPFNGIHTQVVEALTTNETTFFRDVHPFEALKKTVLPELIEKRKHEKRLLLWSAASSSGQEAYSLAMLIREHFPVLATWDVRILATDLSREMVQRTREGCYSQLEINRGLPVPLLLKYFTKQGLTWQIHADLRKMIDARELNLAKDWGYLPQMDIIFMRNVMIYFDLAMKRTILAKLRVLLRPEGYLFLGGAETTLNLDDSFERVSFDKASGYRAGK
jgi:chemotaxis protein methyltransferase CheR